MMKYILSMMIYYPIFLNFIIMSSLMLPITKMKFHPMMLLFLLMFLTIFISIKMNLMFKSWIPFIVFLVIIGGLMIIYMYIISLANNEFFKINMNQLLMYLMKNFMCLLMLNFIIYKYSFLIWNSQDSWNLIHFLEKKNELNFTEMYNLNYMSTLIMMIYLYLSLICIMNMCYKFNSPLRQLFF